MGEQITILEKDVQETSFTLDFELSQDSNYQISVSAVNTSGSSQDVTVPFSTNVSDIPDNIQLKLLVTFDVANALISVTDDISDGYASEFGLWPANIKGILKVSSPSGVIYQNSGWDADDYSNKDINGGSAKWNLENITMPLSNDGELMLGEFLFEYKLSVDGSGNTNYYGVFKYLNLFTPPKPVIDVSIDTASSKMIVVDSTQYGVGINGNTIFPKNNLNTGDRLFMLRYPLGSGNPNKQTHEQNITVNPLWTGNYDISLKSLLQYEFANSDSLRVRIIKTVSALDDSVKIRDNSFKKEVLECIESIKLNYNKIRKYNLREAEILDVTINDFMFYYTMYINKERAGGNTEYSINKLKELMTKSGCSYKIIDDINSKVI